MRSCHVYMIMRPVLDKTCPEQLDDSCNNHNLSLNREAWLWRMLCVWGECLQASAYVCCTIFNVRNHCNLLVVSALCAEVFSNFIKALHLSSFTEAGILTKFVLSKLLF